MAVKTRIIATRLELGYADVLDIIAKREGMTTSEYLRSFLIPHINKELGEGEGFEKQPSDFFFRQAQDWLQMGLAKQEAEKAGG